MRDPFDRYTRDMFSEPFPPEELEPHQRLIETYAERIRREQEDEHYLRLSHAWETNQPKRDEESEWDR